MRSENFTWRSNFNVAHNENRILELADGVERYSLGGFDNLAVYAMVGGDYGEIYGTKFARVDDPASPYYGQLVLNSSVCPRPPARSTSARSRPRPTWAGPTNFSGRTSRSPSRSTHASAARSSRVRSR